MIISQRHRFIFIKNKKTAGSSVQQALGAICGPECLITLARDRYYLPEGHGRAHDELGAHASIAPIIRSFGAALAGYAIIACERNPFDKLVSSYFFKGHRLGFPAEGVDVPADFAARVSTGFFDGVMSPRQYCINGKPIVDFLIRFEHLGADFAAMADRLGLPDTLRLPETHYKSNLRPDIYRGAEGLARLFTPSLITLVQQRYPFYFETLGYGGPGSDCPPFQPHPKRHAIRRRLEAQAAAFEMQIPLPVAG